MQHTWQSLIDRARVYVDDDNYTDDGMLSPESWLTLANVEYAQLYRRFIRMGLITPAVVQETLDDNPYTIASGALAILGVAEDLGGSIRMLTPPNVQDPFWTSSTEASGRSMYWKATGLGDTVTLELYPDDEGRFAPLGPYFVRYIPTVAYATDPTATVDLPYGADERLVLGLARRANIKGLTASALLERMIMETDAELNFQSFGKIQFPTPSPRGMFPRRGDRVGSVFPASPAQWLFLG